MKYHFSIILFLFAAIASHAQPAAKKIAVTVKGGVCSMGKINISGNWMLDPVTKKLGKAERIRGGYNTTHTYDNYGIVLFEKNDTGNLPAGILSELQFYFGTVDSNAVRPTGLFVGTMQIEKASISSSITPAALKDQLKDYVESESYMPHNFRLAYQGIYLYFLFNTEETALLKVSVGKESKKMP